MTRSEGTGAYACKLGVVGQKILEASHGGQLLQAAVRDLCPPHVQPLDLRKTCQMAQPLIADVNGIVERDSGKSLAAGQVLQTVVADRTMSQSDARKLRHIVDDGQLAVADKGTSESQLGHRPQLLQCL